jgi:hypothetical protein
MAHLHLAKFAMKRSALLRSRNQSDYLLRQGDVTQIEQILFELRNLPKASSHFAFISAIAHDISSQTLQKVNEHL